MNFSKSLDRLDGVPGVGLDNICHLGSIRRIMEIGNRVHPSVLEMIPDNALKANQVVRRLEESLVSLAPEVVAFLGRRNVLDRPKLIRRRVFQHTTNWIQTRPRRVGFASSQADHSSFVTKVRPRMTGVSGLINVPEFGAVLKVGAPPARVTGASKVADSTSAMIFLDSRTTVASR